jgi:hypothetical protein
MLCILVTWMHTLIYLLHHELFESWDHSFIIFKLPINLEKVQHIAQVNKN